VSSGSPPPVRVLCVDDNRDAAESLAMILRLVGFEVTVCFDAATALLMASRVVFDVCVSDINMPGVSGYELARQLRAAANGEPLYLVALTARTSEEDRVRSYEAGFDLHLVKPADPLELIGTVRTNGERIAALRRGGGPTPSVPRSRWQTA
jgi:two-component system OmpR family response regulator